MYNIYVYEGDVPVLIFTSEHYRIIDKDKIIKFDGGFMIEYVKFELDWDNNVVKVWR